MAKDDPRGHVHFKVTAPEKKEQAVSADAAQESHANAFSGAG
ncbi:MAG: hypothetical protein Q9P14_11920 [candidate division KSB1 bacterium]|nr:hypothetical protein [candidate division KSB1 bacterium]